MLRGSEEIKSEWLSGNIFDTNPRDWRDLQDHVAKVFREIGCVDVKTPYKLLGVRTTKEVDVYAVDGSVVPSMTIACECKYWESAVPQGVVLEFRSVLEDSGVNRGFIISKFGFQSGAFDAARNTPVVLENFDGFMNLFFDKWLTAMSLRLRDVSDRLFPFFDIYWFESLPALPEHKIQLFDQLRSDYRVLLTAARIVDGTKVPVSIGIVARNPEIIMPLKALRIASYRQFFDVLFSMAERALADFCSLFGLDPARFGEESPISNG